MKKDGQGLFPMCEGSNTTTSNRGDASKPPVILHLSDLHFGYDSSEQQQSDRKLVLDHLGATITSLDLDWRPDIVCVSGDIGYRGHRSDYVEAKAWLDRFLPSIGLSYGRLVLCPGNHDLDRHKSREITGPRDEGEADEHLSIDNWKSFHQPFEDYRRFCQEACIPEFRLGNYANYLVGIREVCGLRFVCCNSAWFHVNDSANGRLWIGLPLIRYMESKGELPLVGNQGNASKTIALLHHPERDLARNETSSYPGRCSTLDYLGQRCHLILTGHSHSLPDEPSERKQALLVKAGATYNDHRYANSFYLLRIEETQLVWWPFIGCPESSGLYWRKHGEPQEKWWPFCVRAFVRTNLDENSRRQPPERKTVEEQIAGLQLELRRHEQTFEWEKGAVVAGQLRVEVEGNKRRLAGPLIMNAYELLAEFEFAKEKMKKMTGKPWDLSLAKHYLAKAKGIR